MLLFEHAGTSHHRSGVSHAKRPQSLIVLLLTEFFSQLWRLCTCSYTEKKRAGKPVVTLLVVVPRSSVFLERSVFRICCPFMFAPVTQGFRTPPWKERPPQEAPRYKCPQELRDRDFFIQVRDNPFSQREKYC